MKYEKYSPDLQKVLDFHGHMCPGIAMGYRLAKAALTGLGYDSPEQGDLVVIAESERCTIDSFQIILGCTIGKGNLRINNTGKQVFSVGCRQSGKAVRVVQLPYEYPPENDELTRRVMSGRVSDEEYQQYKETREKRIVEILSMPQEKLLSITPVKINFSDKEPIYNSPCCQFCGEQVMEPWIRQHKGNHICISCIESAAKQSE